MSVNPRRRDDISKFLVHLTRDEDGIEAIDKLVNILKDKQIEARAPHCLFNFEFDKLKFNKELTNKFNSVCLTETPLNQIKYLTKNILGRKVRLKPYGLVFWKEELLELGANPAIYINSKGTNLKNLLLENFRRDFKDIKGMKSLKTLKYFNELIQYNSLINIVEDKHDFSWEREWRLNNNLDFEYINLIAIIAKDDELFLKKCSREISKEGMKYLRKVPIISPDWNHEEVIEAISCTIWDNFDISED